MSLGQEDFLDKEMATQSSILAWEIPWTEGPDGLQSIGLKRLSTWKHTHTHTLIVRRNENKESWQNKGMIIFSLKTMHTGCKAVKEMINNNLLLSTMLIF